MVLAKYNKTNPLILCGYRLQYGMNDIKDEAFWEMMKSKTFAFRVKTRIIEVPKDFPLEKPRPQKTQPEQNQVESKEEEFPNLPSEKGLLKAIQTSKDLVFLQGLLDTDPREKIKEAAFNRLEKLQPEEKTVEE